MELLPPVGWADVATKNDLHGVETVLKGDIHRFEAVLRADMNRGFAEIRAEMHSGLRNQLYWILGFMITIQGAFAALMRFG